jgi:ribonuclease-3
VNKQVRAVKSSSGTQEKATVAGQLAMHRTRLADLETRLGYRFQARERLLTALMHSSFVMEHGGEQLRNNEVLEFLGDAVLDLAVGMSLLQTFSDASEGELTRMRAALVNEGSLAGLAVDLRLDEAIFLGKGEEASGGRRKSSILSCAFEAVIGAVFVDGGYEAAREVAELQFASLVAQGKTRMLATDAKSRLQELSQQRFNEAPTYGLEKAEGPDHAKCFTVSVRFQGRVLATAAASSKKEAEQRAAAAALKSFDEHDFNS